MEKRVDGEQEGSFHKVIIRKVGEGDKVRIVSYRLVYSDISHT